MFRCTHSEQISVSDLLMQSVYRRIFGYWQDTFLELYVAVTIDCNELQEETGLGLFEVTSEDVIRLNQWQLTDLLRRLLIVEADAEGIPLSSLSVSMNISAGDGGEDGRIQWTGGPDNTKWLPRRLVLFQCKATDMTESDCKKEILKKKNKPEDPLKLKDRVKDVLDQGGSYVLFCSRSYNTDNQEPRLAGFRKSLEDVEGQTYADSADLHIYDADKISNWVNCYPSIVAIVREWLGLAQLLNAQTWDSWAKYGDNKFKFVENDDVRSRITWLRSHLARPCAVARLMGLSGLGKTRLAMEAFRPPVDESTFPEQHAFSREVVYVDATILPADLVAAVAGWRREEKRVVVVVDNCELTLHNLLRKEVEASGSRLSLLTLDYEPVSEQDITADDIIILPSSELVKGIIEQAYQDVLSKEDIERIVEFAEGFPRIAVLLAQARLKDEKNVCRLKDPELVQRLILGRQSQTDATAENVIRICSLFEHLGVYNGAAGHYQYVASNIASINKDTFYGCVQEFLKRGILQRRGDYIRVVPKPLAVRLAGDWWEKCPEDLAKELLAGTGMPTGLQEALSMRFSHLNDLSFACEFVQAMCDQQGPFGQTEVLLSERGSRLFCWFVEVNPLAAVGALQRTFGSRTRDELLMVGPARRNLVRALEKLCFWEETFPVAASLMLALAEAENETWANNATGQFLQLYHVHLSGTKAPPQLRCEVVDKALASDSIYKRILAVKALGEALESRGTHRLVGVEIQGSRMPDRDWQPKTWGEMFDYWRAALERLTPIATEAGELGDLAREQICRHIRGLVRHGLMDELESMLSSVVSKRGELWPEALGAILLAQRYEGPKIPDEGRIRLENWIKMLQPNSIPDKLRLVVSIPPFDHEKSANGSYIDLSAQKAKSLAEELAASFDSWSVELDIIFIGEQRQGYTFGYHIGKHISKPELFVNTALGVLSQASQDGNAVVLAGFLAAIQPSNTDLVRDTLDEMANNENLVRYIVDITRAIQSDKSDLDRVLQLVECRCISVVALRSFAYGRALDHLPSAVVSLFCQEMSKRGPEGVWAALEVLSMYCHGNDQRWLECRNTFHSFILSKPLSSGGNTHGLDLYEWQEAVERLLAVEGGDNELALSVTSDLVEFFADGGTGAYTAIDYAQPIIQRLFSMYKEQVWTVIGSQLLTREGMDRLNLLDMLRGRLGEIDAPRVVESLPPEYLMQWCTDNGPGAAVVLAYAIPIFSQSDKDTIWNPLATWLLDNYGANEDVLQSLAANMLEACGWIGSLTQQWESQVTALEQLTSHSIPQVRAWAQELTDALRKDIADAKKREEERGITW